LDVTNGISMPIGGIQIIGGISSGGSGIVQVPYDTTGKEGERTIQVVVDPANVIAETKEDDNQVEKTLTVGPPSEEPTIQPNLVMTSNSVSFTPTLPLPGDIVTLTVKVHNDGGSDANGVVVRVMDVTTTPVQVGDDVTIPIVAAGQTMTATVIYATGETTGTRSLTVSADPDNTITESNENDNTATVTIPIGGSNGEPPTNGQGIDNSPPIAPVEPETPDEDDEASVDILDPRQETPAPGLHVELAEDLNRRD
jgi:uncharacterized repeat protein (TIGR01451 family)